MYSLKFFFNSNYIFILFFWIGKNNFAQTNSNDSLSQKTINQLVDHFYDYELDSIKASPYAYEYLKRAKTINDTIQIANGYYFLSCISKKEVSNSYSDSIIFIIKNKNTKSYPVFAYLNKANIYYNNYNFKKAFDYFLKVNEEAKKHDNEYLLNLSKQSIGILKSRVGEYETALITLKKCTNYYSKNKKDMPLFYLRSLFALSDSYNLNKKLDSASTINELGVRECLALNNKTFLHYFTLNEGINQYAKEKYVRAKDSLEKAIKILEELKEDKANTSMAYFYLGKTLSALGKDKFAIEAHKKVDDLFQEISEIMPNNRENYEILIDFFKKNNDKDNQLKYIQRLIQVDSTLHTNYRYLIKNIVQNYDTPKLLSEKQNIIDTLETEKRSFGILITSLILLCILSILLLGYNYKKQNKYKRRFEELYNVKAGSKNNSEKILSSKSPIEISKNITNEILNKLMDFEKNKGFLDKDLVSNTLAKKFDTNSKYLSKTINTYKKKNFSSYINELRVDYATHKLRTDNTFRNYTVRAISREVGFKSDESFSKAFYKKNGIRPSYFIKQIEKKLLEERN